jgi:hypothetical protein
MRVVRYKYVTVDVDRHDNIRYYFRRRGLTKKTRLPGVPGTPEFQAAYEALFAGKPLPAGQPQSRWRSPHPQRRCGGSASNIWLAPTSSGWMSRRAPTESAFSAPSVPL